MRTLENRADSGLTFRVKAGHPPARPPLPVLRLADTHKPGSAPAGDDNQGRAT